MIQSFMVPQFTFTHKYKMFVVIWRTHTNATTTEYRPKFVYIKHNCTENRTRHIGRGKKMHLMVAIKMAN